MSEIEDPDGLQEEVANVFSQAFGRTPLKQRLQDIQNEAIELNRSTDMRNLKEELGDLLASAIQLATELDLPYESCVYETLEKIKRRLTQYQTLGRKLKVALFGGAFNPITTGHIAVAKFVLDASKEFDEVWFMPCFNHMYGKDMATADQRMTMCQIAARTDGRLRAFDYEIKRELRGDTFQLVKLLLEEDFAKNEFDFSLIIGMDNAATFEQWVNHEILKQMIRFVVVPRKGYSLEDAKSFWFLEPPHIYLGRSDNPLPETSSTQVREAICRQEDISELVPPGVEHYIRERKLYAQDY